MNSQSCSRSLTRCKELKAPMPASAGTPDVRASACAMAHLQHTCAGDRAPSSSGVRRVVGPVACADPGSGAAQRVRMPADVNLMQDRAWVSEHLPQPVVHPADVMNWIAHQTVIAFSIWLLRFHLQYIQLTCRSWWCAPGRSSQQSHCTPGRNRIIRLFIEIPSAIHSAHLPQLVVRHVELAGGAFAQQAVIGIFRLAIGVPSAIHSTHMLQLVVQQVEVAGGAGAHQPAAGV